ncbi:MAG TPA: helix-turn-helix domain-containing protein, partial [Pseudonocardiaceae bacterium]|nr:helix-turn-helix domain-containing protein [Pseudonocardiaceae bacterium]
IFDAFTPDEPVLQVSEIARRSGLHLATASRLVAELVAHGLLARDTDRRVRVGVRMWELALRASPLGVAVPIRDGRGTVVAALSAIVPNDDDGRAVPGVLLTAARGISRSLSGSPLIQ